MPTKYQQVEESQTFIQIIHIERSHWIVVSNSGCCEGCLKAYDSLYNTLSLRTKKQICLILEVAKVNEVTLQMPNIQRQPNASDCGVFAIAFSTEIFHGKDPMLSYWDVSKMRLHLMESLI